MSVQVIAMLTNDDRTVENALAVFEENKHARTRCWGFKDIGIDTEAAAGLVAAMKAAGKTTFLEPLLEDEENCVKNANFAVKCGFDCVLGMVYNQKAADILREAGVEYLPTCGRREGLPRMLYGTPEEIIADAERLTHSRDMKGVCLSVYRYVDGDPEQMALALREKMVGKMIVSGGINSFSRLDFVKSLQPWGFTIGSALFTQRFGARKSIAEQLDIIQEYIEAP